MAADRVERCRELLHRSRAAWRAGHGDEAWALLDEAEGLQDAAPSLPAEVLAVRAGVLLLAERMVEAATTADRALASASAVGGHDRQLLLAAADARVTKASALVGSADRASVDQLAAALELLDEVALDPDLADTTPAARAVNNALNLRLEALGPRLHDTASQVEAWTRVGEARALTAGWRDHGSILRQAVDLAFSTGQWERGWDYAHRQLEAEHERNEQVAVLAKAAHLAWHRGMLPETRELGTRARALSVAVDHPWVRTYAYLGGVLAAVAGAGSVSAALTAYTACTTAAGHATRPHRVGQAALVALEAGHPPGEVREFLQRTLPGGRPDSRILQLVDLLTADAEGKDLDPDDVGLPRHLLAAPERAQACLVLARWHRRHDRLTAASAVLREAQLLLRDWPGRLLDLVTEEIALTHPPVEATEAQRRVLDLLAEGLGNAEIAARLGVAERTVAVHVAAMLRANGARSRTELAARHLRHQLTPG